MFLRSYIQVSDTFTIIDIRSGEHISLNVVSAMSPIMVKVSDT